MRVRRPVGTRTPDLYRVKVAALGFTTTYKTAGTAKVRGSLARQIKLWVGQWVGKSLNAALERATSPNSCFAVGERGQRWRVLYGMRPLDGVLAPTTV